ncbi:MAG: helix-turn-helix domain-containing protein [Gammaproteobacteria bacterium]|nr:helix-turn-helix domain-containing protein [Gammaproteobacteria bacterium]
MLFEDVHTVWTERRLTQEEAAQLLGVCPRTFRRWSARYEEDGIEGLRDRRLSRASHRAVPPSRGCPAGGCRGRSRNSATREATAP